MKLLYIANNRIPSEKANSLQIVQMCAAFQKLGVEVTLVAPRRVQTRQMRGVIDPFAYYGLDRRFPIDRLPCIDLLEIAPSPAQQPAFAVQAATFGLSALVYLASHGADIYYSRDPLSSVMFALAPRSIRARTLFEAHTFPLTPWRRRLHVWATKRLGGVVCITQGLAKEYAARSMQAERILVAPDAVDLDRFRAMPGKLEARDALGIPESATVVAYAGHLYPWKGAHTLALASRDLPEGYQVYVVGGTEEDHANFSRFLRAEGLQKVHAVRHVPPDRVPLYLAAADVLALPNSASTEASARYTSPMKLFEYMAARKPIVASRLPSLQEVLRDGENALLVEPDDPTALAAGIIRAASESAVSATLAEQAWRDVQDCSWDARARAILEFALAPAPEVAK